MQINISVLANSLDKTQWWIFHRHCGTGRITTDLNIAYPLNYYFEYVWAEKNLAFDENGIRVCTACGAAGNIYSPTLILDFAMRAFQRYLRSNDPYWKERWLSHVRWICGNQFKEGENSGGWIFDFPLPDVGTKAGFLNASAQGLAMSVLSRAWIVTKDPGYRDCAGMAMLPLTRLSGEGGVCFMHKGTQKFFETYPSSVPNYILGGHMRALLGLRDLSVFTGNKEAELLFKEGVETLKQMLPLYDNGFWSRYSLRPGFPHVSCLTYHMSNIDNLRILYLITGDPAFAEYWEKFKGYAQSRICNLKAVASKILWRVPKLHVFRNEPSVN